MALLRPSVTRANGTLMARRRLRGPDGPGARDQREPLTWGFTLERVTGIEPALSAWESDRSGPLTALTWATDAPRVTVIDPMTPRLMARQWPATLPALVAQPTRQALRRAPRSAASACVAKSPTVRSIGPRDLGDGFAVLRL
jgi:hypothetical protein